MAELVLEETLFDGLTLSDREKCPICLEKIKHITGLSTCSHKFCIECISSWSKKRRNCPLCNVEFNCFRIVQVDGTFEEKAVPTPSFIEEADIVNDLECLDHTYFLEETRRLLRATEHAQPRFRPSVMNSKSWESRNWDTLQQAIVRLKEFVNLFMSDEHFEPYAILQELYDIEERVNAVMTDPLGMRQASMTETVVRYGADDFEDLLSDSDDDFRDDWKDSQSSKKQRKPNGRIPTSKKSNGKKKREFAFG